MKKETKPAEFVENEWLNTLCRIQADEPKRFAQFSPSLQMSVEHYQLARQRAHEVEKGTRAA